MTATEKTTILSAVRQLLYCAGCFGVTFLQYVIAAACKEKTLLACALFLVVSLRRKDLHKLGIVFASLCAFAACRELDALFDDCIPVIGWKFAFLFITAATVYAFINWKRTHDEIFSFLRSSAFPMMCFVIIIVIPVAQCIGHRSFVANVLQMDHIGSIKEFIEESIETIGYFILLCSAIELLCPPPRINH